MIFFLKSIDISLRQSGRVKLHNTQLHSKYDENVKTSKYLFCNYPPPLISQTLQSSARDVPKQRTSKDKTCIKWRKNILDSFPCTDKCHSSLYFQDGWDILMRTALSNDIDAVLQKINSSRIDAGKCDTTANCSCNKNHIASHHHKENIFNSSCQEFTVVFILFSCT